MDENLQNKSLFSSSFQTHAQHKPVTVAAFEWLRPSVLPKVSGQLVAPCKTPLAALPGTPVGFLA